MIFRFCTHNQSRRHFCFDHILAWWRHLFVITLAKWTDIWLATLICSGTCHDTYGEQTFICNFLIFTIIIFAPYIMNRQFLHRISFLDHTSDIDSEHPECFQQQYSSHGEQSWNCHLRTENFIHWTINNFPASSKRDQTFPFACALAWWTDLNLQTIHIPSHGEQSQLTQNFLLCPRLHSDIRLSHLHVPPHSKWFGIFPHVSLNTTSKYFALLQRHTVTTALHLVDDVLEQDLSSSFKLSKKLSTSCTP